MAKQTPKSVKVKAVKAWAVFIGRGENAFVACSSTNGTCGLAVLSSREYACQAARHPNLARFKTRVRQVTILIPITPKKARRK